MKPTALIFFLLIFFSLACTVSAAVPTPTQTATQRVPTVTPTPKPVPTPTANAANCVRVTAFVLTVRSKPNANALALDWLMNGEVVTVRTNALGWLEIQSNAYVREKYTEPTRCP